MTIKILLLSVVEANTLTGSIPVRSAILFQ